MLICFRCANKRCSTIQLAFYLHFLCRRPVIKKVLKLCSSHSSSADDSEEGEIQQKTGDESAVEAAEPQVQISRQNARARKRRKRKKKRKGKTRMIRRFRSRPFIQEPLIQPLLSVDSTIKRFRGQERGLLRGRGHSRVRGGQFARPLFAQNFPRPGLGFRSPRRPFINRYSNGNHDVVDFQSHPLGPIFRKFPLRPQGRLRAIAFDEIPKQRKRPLQARLKNRQKRKKYHMFHLLMWIYNIVLDLKIVSLCIGVGTEPVKLN